MKSTSIPLCFVALCTVSALGAQKPDLNGTVLTETGHALSNATVFIYTAGPKVGVGTL